MHSFSVQLIFFVGDIITLFNSEKAAVLSGDLSGKKGRVKGPFLIIWPVRKFMKNLPKERGRLKKEGGAATKATPKHEI